MCHEVLSSIKMLRLFFKYQRRVLGDLCRLALRSLTHYFEALTGSELTPGVIVAIQTFGDRINFHPHLHLLLTEGGVDKAGVFHKWPRIDDSRLAAIFAREILADMVRKELLSSVWADRLSLDKEEGKVIYRIINHLKLRLIAAKSPPTAHRLSKNLAGPFSATLARLAHPFTPRLIIPEDGVR